MYLLKMKTWNGKTQMTMFYYITATGISTNPEKAVRYKTKEAMLNDYQRCKLRYKTAIFEVVVQEKDFEKFLSNSDIFSF